MRRKLTPAEEAAYAELAAAANKLKDAQRKARKRPKPKGAKSPTLRVYGGGDLD